MTLVAQPVRMSAADDDFAGFVDEVARQVESHVEPWRLRVGEAAARWRDDGVRVDVLERALRLRAAPDVDALLTAFGSAVARLRAARARAIETDPSLAAHPVFADPARVAEAEALVRPSAPRVQQPALAAVPDDAPNAWAAAVDLENWVLDWPDVGDLLIEAWP